MKKVLLFFPRNKINLISSSYLTGCVKENKDNYHVNVLDHARLDNAVNEDTIGVFMKQDEDVKHFRALKNQAISFIIREDNSIPLGIDIHKIWIHGQEVSNSHLTIYLYNKSQISSLKTPTQFPFLNFLTETSKTDERLKTLNLLKTKPKSIDPEDSKSTVIYFRFLLDLINKSAVANHLLRRKCELAQIFDSNIVCERKYLVLGLTSDIILGSVFVWLINYIVSPDIIFMNGIATISKVVTTLKSLLHWLMGVPAGLKLNRPLISALGYFFLYHIHLWETYISVIWPIFTILMHTFIFLGACGFSTLLCLLSDIVSLSTMHIYCFYGYAARLYSLEIKGLVSLSRLFRGKKWNPLKERVDSYKYGNKQLLLGTFLLTILLFLFPTIFLYYLVFTVLRLVVFSIHTILTKMIQTVDLLPFVIYWACGLAFSHGKGNVEFTIIGKTDSHCLIYDLKVSPDTSFKYFKKNYCPQTNKNDFPHWHEIFKCLVWGDLIVPL